MIQKREVETNLNKIMIEIVDEINLIHKVSDFLKESEYTGEQERNQNI